MKLKSTIILFILILTSSSNIYAQAGQDYEKKILGTWEVNSAIVYSHGKESKISKTSEMNRFVGSFSIPKIYSFTEYDEVFFDTYPKNGKFHRAFSSYKISKDKVILGSNSTWKIISLTSKELVLRQELKVNYFDNSKKHSKKYYTYYFKKKS